MINERMKMFCRYYVSNHYNARQAYISAYGASKPVADVNAYKLLHREDIQEYIRELQKDTFAALGISAEKIAIELNKLAFSEIDENNSTTSKLKALELLAKQLGLYTTKVEADVNNNIVVTITDDQDKS